MLKQTIVILLTTIFWQQAIAQQVQVEASLDSNLLLIGQQTTLNITVTKPNSLGIRFPFFVDTLTRNVEILEVADVDSVVIDENTSRLSQQLTITSFDSGFHYIRPLPIVAANNGLIDTFYTEGLGLEIVLVPVDTTQAIKAIKGIEEVPLTFRELLPYLLIGLLVLLLGLGILFYLRRRGQAEKPIFTPSKPKEPAHVIALRALNELEREEYWQKGQIKPFYSGLTDILKAYIEQRYNFPAVEQTTDEVLDTFSNSGMQTQIPYEQLQQLLFLSDLVKFAKAKPSIEEHKRSFDQVVQFVNETKVSLAQQEIPQDQDNVNN